MVTRVSKKGLDRRTFLTGAGAVLAVAPFGLAAASDTDTTGATVTGTTRPESLALKDVLDDGHRFFGSVSRGFASVIEEAGRRWGEPNGYVLGQEAGAAFIGGLRYGEGKLYTRNAGEHRVYWQGPSLGVDAGADGARTMMLVYELPSVEAIYQRFGGVDGSAYLVGGFGMTALTADTIVIVPIRTGVGARLGVNIGYLKFTPTPTWNPF